LRGQTRFRATRGRTAWAGEDSAHMVVGDRERGGTSFRPGAGRGTASASIGSRGLPTIHFRYLWHSEGRADLALKRSRVYQLGDGPLSVRERGPLLADLRPDIRSLRIAPVRGVGGGRMCLCHVADRSSGAEQIRKQK